MSLFVMRGSTLQIRNLSINFASGELSSPIVEMGYDVFPLWLDIAVKSARAAERAAAELDGVWDGSGDPKIVSLLEKEVMASMQAVVAAAAAVDGFYGSALARTPIISNNTKKARSRGRHRKLIAFFLQKFAIDTTFSKAFEQSLREIFEFRHSALHSHGKPEELGFHPRHNIAMAKKVVVFRAENAILATKIALTLISYLIISPRSKHEELQKYCHAARAWIVPIVSDWLSDHEESDLSLDWFAFGPSRHMFERKGLLPHWRHR